MVLPVPLQVTGPEPRVLAASVHHSSYDLSLQGPTEVPLEPVDDAGRTLGLLSEGNPPESGLLLTVEGVRTNLPPDTPYRIYLDHAEGEPGESPYFVGWISFFGSVETGGAGHGGQDVTYDITDQVRRLQAASLWPQGGVTVAITPSTPLTAELAAEPSAPRPTFERVTLSTS
ncbi:hypothetical protein [Streptomyces chattanoogensis]|uniref:DUF7868 domain-containing protein n=1 Tax=Streptomyces chattanoogensis TaxID=66876 RepID=A0A0N0GW78_9ACTN|nr:hypothetical protein [Streptomyces chattanoogensis]KPC59929.1 hypothetical protein ADL29_32285 [Streptomyces chattanoogensis]